MDVKTLLSQTDLVELAEKYTDLTKQGNVYRGVCPVCGHDNDSEFCVYDHRTYHCWACNSSGDAINLLKDKFNLDFFGAAEKLADIMNIDLTHDTAYRKKKEAISKKQQWAEDCHKNVKVVEDYLVQKRKLSKETIEYFKLGADMHGNVTIPLTDRNGCYVGWALRRFEGTKYLTCKNDESFTKSEYLFNMRGALQNLHNNLYLVEGFFCAMTLQQWGLAGVAYNSSRPTKQHIQMLAELAKTRPELTVTLIPDNDGVAYPLVEKVRKDILRYAPDLPVEIMLLPSDAKDVNEALEKGCTAEQFEEFPCESIDLFVLKGELEKCNSMTAERRTVEKYARTVSDNLTLLDIADYLAERWQTEKKPVQDFLHVSQDGTSLEDDFKSPEQCVAETIKMLKEATVQYGVPVLDEGIRGAGRRKDVLVIGASSGAGKTYLAVQMAADMVVRQHKYIIFFSFEMSAGALFERILAYLLKCSTDIVDQRLLEGDPMVYAILEKLKEHIFVIDKNGLSIKELDDYVKEANAKLFDGQLDCIFIDYLQYMKGCEEYQVLAETAKGLKPLAKDNNIHVVALSQLNRGVMAWEKPDMGKLKGGGDIEASADEILLMWRPGKDPAMSPEEKKIRKNTVMIAVGKARHGSKIEEVEMELDPTTSRIKMV